MSSYVNALFCGVMKFMNSNSLISGSQYKTFSCLNIWKTVYSKRIVCFKTISRFLTRRKTKNPCIYLRKILYKNKSYVHSDSKYLQKWKYWRLLCREYFVFLHILMIQGRSLTFLYPASAILSAVTVNLFQFVRPKKVKNI